jgi:hypothetical protein
MFILFSCLYIFFRRISRSLLEKSNVDPDGLGTENRFRHQAAGAIAIDEV